MYLLNKVFTVTVIALWIVLVLLIQNAYALCTIPIGFAETTVYRSEGTMPNPTMIPVRFHPVFNDKVRIELAAVQFDPLLENGAHNLKMGTPTPWGPWYAGNKNTGHILGGKLFPIRIPHDGVCQDRSVVFRIIGVEAGKYACIDHSRNTMTIIIKDYGDC